MTPRLMLGQVKFQLEPELVKLLIMVEMLVMLTQLEKQPSVVKFLTLEEFLNEKQKDKPKNPKRKKRMNRLLRLLRLHKSINKTRKQLPKPWIAKSNNIKV